MATQHILQVSELTKKVRFLLESELNTVWICGEISNFIAASSGHWYLSLKDKKSQVKCAMFKGNNRRCRITPKNGQQVLIRAKVSLYEPRGDFQLIIDQMEDAGDGVLRQAYEHLKSTLSSQGYFLSAHKKSMPEHVKKIGLITSPTGAAVQDMISVFKRRDPSLELLIYPCLVQGKQATEDIVHAIELANERDECQVLIIGRGGGSLEDLWCFNEEQVVKAIFSSKIPTISAVGHEIDTTLSDLVADLRAPTPSAAAELISIEHDLRAEQVSLKTKTIVDLHRRAIKQKHQHLAQFSHRLKQAHPMHKLQLQQQRFDDLSFRLKQHQQLKFKLNHQRLLSNVNQLNRLSPLNKIVQEKKLLVSLQDRLYQSLDKIVVQKQQHFRHVIEQLNLISPLATIARGYGIVRNDQRKLVTSVKQIKEESEIVVQVADGEITAQVKNIIKTNN